MSRVIAGRSRLPWPRQHCSQGCCSRVVAGTATRHRDRSCRPRQRRRTCCRTRARRSRPEASSRPPRPIAEVPVFRSRSSRTPFLRLANPTSDDTPLVFLVRRRLAGRDEVYLPVRPDGATGWIDESDVDLARNPYSIRVSLSAHELVVDARVTRGDEAPRGRRQPAAAHADRDVLHRQPAPAARSVGALRAVRIRPLRLLACSLPVRRRCRADRDPRHRRALRASAATRARAASG